MRSFVRLTTKSTINQTVRKSNHDACCFRSGLFILIKPESCISVYNVIDRFCCILANAAMGGCKTRNEILFFVFLFWVFVFKQANKKQQNPRRKTETHEKIFQCTLRTSELFIYGIIILVEVSGSKSLPRS